MNAIKKVIHSSQWAHNVETTSIQRQYVESTLNRRCFHKGTQRRKVVNVKRLTTLNRRCSNFVCPLGIVPDKKGIQRDIALSFSTKKHMTSARQNLQ